MHRSVPRQLTRRLVLTFAVPLCAGLVIAACSKKASPPAETAVAPAPAPAPAAAPAPTPAAEPTMAAPVALAPAPAPAPAPTPAPAPAPAPPPPPPPPPPPAEPVLTPEQMADLNRAQRTIFFAYNSAALDKTAVSALDDKVRLLTTYPRVRIAIAGNCDARGTEEYNVALGDKRAAAARDYLVDHGIAADRIDVTSNGSSQPVDKGDTEAAWKKNRNDQFSVIIPKQ